MKRSLVHQMQAHGDTVAMTGDGVNDVLALKDADCSVAMASGSEAAANVAQIVLLESDFSRMPQVLQEGRRVVNNIERSAGLFLIKNIFSFLMAIFSMIMVVDYPLEPEQVSMINAFTIGTPAFLLALENNKNLIKGKFISNVMFNALPAALTDFITIGCLVMYCNMKGIDSSTISTLTTFVVSAIGFMVLVMISRPMNTFRTAVIAALAVGFLLCAHYMRWWFEIERINLMIVLMFAVFAALAAVILAVSHKCIQRLARRLKK
jgi:cation-transporting ATPase E